MRRALLVLLLLAGAALAQGAGTPLPFNPWESAATGDWETLTVDVKFEGPKAAMFEKAFTKLESVTYHVKGADDKEVKIDFDIVPGDAVEERIATIFSRTVAPAFDQLLNVKGEVKDVKLTDEKRTVAGRAFPCTRIAYATVTQRGARSENVVWFSKDVRTFGLVELQNVVPLGQDTKCTLTYRLSGFGRKGTVEFGKKPDDRKK